MKTVKLHVYNFTDVDIDAGKTYCDLTPTFVEVTIPEETRLSYVMQPGHPNRTLDFGFSRPVYEITDEKARGLAVVSINGVKYRTVER
jgi:hypothetical protein